MHAVKAYGGKILSFLKRHRAARIAGYILLAALALMIALRPRGRQNYLILGIDNYGSLNENGRSDVMMLVSLDFDRGGIAAVTFARDMFIENDHGTRAKINAIVRNQDEDALALALEQNFGVKIDGWFRVNFSSFISIVDAIGGAQLELTDEEARYIDRTAGAYPDSPLGEGVCRLNGAQALTYARCRKLDNDIGRGNRQSKLFEALVKQTRRMTAANVASLASGMSHAWQSSLSGAEQAALVFRALWLRGAHVTRLAVPFEGYWRYGSAGNANGILADIEANRRLLLEALRLPAPSPAAGQAG